MSIFRSERMTLWQMFLQTDAVYQSVAEIGELGIVEFRDLNPEATGFQRQFASEIKRCYEMERKIRYVEEEIIKDGIKIEDLDHLPNAPLPKEMIDLEAALDKMDHELREINVNAEALTRNYMSLMEMKLTLKYADMFLGESTMTGVNDFPNSVDSKTGSGAEEAATGQQNSMQHFRFLAGVVELEKIVGFERILWRTGRGNVFFRMVSIENELTNPITGAATSKKAVFIAFYQGDQLKARVKKICDGYHASLYPCPELESQRRETSIGINSRLEDLNIILKQTKDHRHRVLKAASRHILYWVAKVRKIKGIFHMMNMFNVDVTSKALVAECWIPDDDVESVRNALKRASEMSESSFAPILTAMSTNQTPPTFFRTNKFTSGFQTLVNAYGMANYREVNPGLYTIITFPFLFAVMFGDAGHGLVVTLFAAYLCLKEESLKKVKGEVFGIIFGGRYIILLMGLFSIYTGMIYNDIFSKSFDIFGSAWKVNIGNESLQHHDLFMLSPNPDDYCTESDKHPEETCGHYRGDPYPFGVDPVWILAKNNIVFLNSYKMKLSIILGVFHMTFGIFLNIWNFTYFKKRLSLVLEFMPRILFFWPLFGYLMSLMFLKWIEYGADKDRKYKTDCAPSILITFINMMLLSYSDDKVIASQPECVTLYMYGGLEGTQKIIQYAFLIIAVINVPILLFGTPIEFLVKQKKTNAAHNAIYSSNSRGSSDPEEDHQPIVSSASVSGEGGDNHGGSFGDVMIYQAIHTIEYVLECISHTASYLRLWALSLAHSQLSEVLWFMVLRIGFHTVPGFGGCILIFLTWGFWCGATVAILIAMEGMSAFLHTLRLHWVEFQSKFYKGSGVKFRPFHFRRIMVDSGDD